MDPQQPMYPQSGSQNQQPLSYPDPGPQEPTQVYPGPNTEFQPVAPYYPNPNVAVQPSAPFNQYNNQDKPSSLSDVLHKLKMAKDIKIIQDVEILEAVTTLETNNKYKVMDENDNLLMRIKEKANVFERNICPICRATTVNFMIPDSDLAFMTLKRDSICMCCCMCCFCVCGNEMHLYKSGQAEKDKPFCTITQSCNYCSPDFSVEVDNSVKYNITSTSFCLDSFLPMTKNFKATIKGNDVNIRRKLSTKVVITDADNFSLSIPSELKNDPDADSIILSLIAATIGIDFAYYEHGGDKNRGLYGQYND